jgi:hypothetical protein
MASGEFKVQISAVVKGRALQPRVPAVSSPGQQSLVTGYTGAHPTNYSCRVGKGQTITNFVKSSKRRSQFEILKTKQLLAADVLTIGAGGSETENLTAIHAEEPLSTGTPGRAGSNHLEHGPGLHD